MSVRVDPYSRPLDVRISARMIKCRLSTLRECDLIVFVISLITCFLAASIPST